MESCSVSGAGSCDDWATVSGRFCAGVRIVSKSIRSEIRMAFKESEMMATNSEIVKTGTTQVIPSTDLKGLEGALAELQQVASVLPKLKAKAEAFTIIDTADECKAAKVVLGDIRALRKIGGFKIDPFLGIVKQVGDFLRGERSGHKAKCDALDKPLTQKIRDYDDKETARALEDQIRENEERTRKAREEADAKRRDDEAKAEADRKARQKEIEAARKAGEVGKRESDRLKKEAAEKEQRDREQAAREADAAAAAVKPVTVKPNIPTQAGVVIRRNWRFKIVDATKIPRAFLIPDEQAIGAIVRANKNKTMSAADCP